MMRPLEDQLRSLIDGGVSPVTADEAQRRTTRSEHAGRGRRGGARHQRIAVVVALSRALAAVGAAVLVVGTGHDTTVRVQTSGPSAAPIVAHLITPLGGGYQSQVVELGATSGRVRVLAHVPGGTTSYAITADRHFVYADGFNEQPPGGVPCPGQAKALTSVLRVPRSGGHPVLEATGTRPALSPNDTKLAYLHADCGTRNQPFVPESLAVRALGTGAEHRWSLPPPYTNGNSFGFENVGPFQWAADGTHLLTRVVSGGQPTEPPRGPANWWLVDTTAPSGRLHAAALPIPNSGPDVPLDIIALGSTGRWAALLRPAVPGGPFRVVYYNPTRGAVSTLLTTLQVPTNGTANLVAADASGQHLLLILHVAAPTTPGTPYIADTNDLYRWNTGDTQPTKVASNVVAATW
jgi:hypothetical protein